MRGFVVMGVEAAVGKGLGGGTGLLGFACDGSVVVVIDASEGELEVHFSRGDEDKGWGGVRVAGLLIELEVAFVNVVSPLLEG